ncbi:MAG: ATP synthase F1 subunit delta [Candidatus Angelobacter sp. Gp1-AA117]|nr:MAG: ATP synthase F1 subunit delta [Candidatus Angelobacter sp. Gp1-AA117]
MAVASRYARAFAEVVMDRRIDPNTAIQELETMAELMKSSPELRNVLQNPAVPHSQKLKLLDALIARIGGSKILRNFIAVLIDHHRAGQLHEVAEQFKHELNQRLGIAEAQVRSARELMPEEKQQLEKQMTAITSKVVRATYTRDARLLGGVIVRIGSTIYDGSVRGQLQRIKQQIVSA